MKVRLTVEVSDDFTVGNCRLCPISGIDEDIDGNYFNTCPLWRHDDCPIEVVEE